jgi:hypothetical protein
VTRFDLLVAMGLGLIMLTIGLRWLWHQQWRSASGGRRAGILITARLI